MIFGVTLWMLPAGWNLLDRWEEYRYTNESFTIYLSKYLWHITIQDFPWQGFDILWKIHCIPVFYPSVQKIPSCWQRSQCYPKYHIVASYNNLLLKYRLYTIIKQRSLLKGYQHTFQIMLSQDSLKFKYNTGSCLVNNRAQLRSLQKPNNQPLSSLNL